MPEQFADAVAYLDANNRWALNIAGDAAFFAGARLWLTRFNDSTATTEDFEAVMEKASGQQPDAFFDDWLREGDRPAMPQLSVEKDPVQKNPVTDGTDRHPVSPDASRRR